MQNNFINTIIFAIDLQERLEERFTYLQYFSALLIRLDIANPNLVHQENVVETPEITNHQQALLDQWGVKEEWIPDEFRCGITHAVIDETPVYLRKSPQKIPQRYQEKALMTWLEQNSTDPMTRTAVTEDDIVKDDALGAKIKAYMEYMQTNVELLKSLSPELAQQKIASFLAEVELKRNKKFSVSAFALKQSFFAPQNSVFQLSRQVLSEKDYVAEFANFYGSCYDILQIPLTATREEITRAYKKLALKYHPDKNSSDTTEKFQLIKEAYDILTKPSLKTYHDGILLAERSRLNF